MADWTLPPFNSEIEESGKQRTDHIPGTERKKEDQKEVTGQMKRDGKIDRLRQGQAEAICSPNPRWGKEELEPQTLVSLSALVTKDWQPQLQNKPTVLASLNPVGGGEIMPPPVGPVSCGKEILHPIRASKPLPNPVLQECYTRCLAEKGPIV